MEKNRNELVQFTIRPLILILMFYVAQRIAYG